MDGRMYLGIIPLQQTRQGKLEDGDRKADANEREEKTDITYVNFFVRMKHRTPSASSSQCSVILM